jgi:hypothetical protein
LRLLRLGSAALRPNSLNESLRGYLENRKGQPFE